MSTFRFGLSSAWTPLKTSLVRARKTLRRAARLFNEQLEKAPFRTQLITSTVLWTVGDTISQKLEGHETQDFARTARCASFGLLVSGPAYYWWMPKLQSVFAPLCKTTTQLVGAKVVADQLLFEPPLLASTFAFLAFLEGKSSQEMVDKLKADFVSTFVVDCVFWIPLGALNFRYTPLKYQALFVNSACVLWNGYVSFVNHRKEQAEADRRARVLAAARAEAARAPEKAVMQLL